MKYQNKKTGFLGEGLAREYLQKKGYRIKEGNFRTRFGEIEIVCWDKEILVFVEVKTKIGHDFGELEEMVNKRKISQVKRMGEVYLQDNKLGVACRVDVVAVVLGEDKKIDRISHFEAVY